jgi:arginyl-tRNA synthetase
MVSEAEKQTRELGKLEDTTDAEARELFATIGLGALKFFLLKVDPKKRMLFDPNESIQLQGFTGPFIQYTHARIRAIIRKAGTLQIRPEAGTAALVTTLEPAEREVIQVLANFENKLQEAAREYSPSIIANYAYELAKEYNQFYQSIPIFNESDPAKLQLRVLLSESVAMTIKRAMQLLGIGVPEKM